MWNLSEDSTLGIFNYYYSNFFSIEKVHEKLHKYKNKNS